MEKKKKIYLLKPAGIILIVLSLLIIITAYDSLLEINRLLDIAEANNGEIPGWLGEDPYELYHTRDGLTNEIFLGTIMFITGIIIIIAVFFSERNKNELPPPKTNSQQ